MTNAQFLNLGIGIYLGQLEIRIIRNLLLHFLHYPLDDIALFGFKLVRANLGILAVYVELPKMLGIRLQSANRFHHHAKIILLKFF